MFARYRTPRNGKHFFLGMVHLQALPGASDYGGDFRRVCKNAQRDADALFDGGVDGIILENFFDSPFFPAQTPPETGAAMSAIASRIRNMAPNRLLGVNILRNDGPTALAVAIAAECDFIRVNVLNSVRVTDQGIINGCGAELLRRRSYLGAAEISILADVDVKHSAPLAPRPLEEDALELSQRGGADALIVSGSGTGQATNVNQLRMVKESVGQFPVLVGSGTKLGNIESQSKHCDGFIVGVNLKRDGAVTNEIDAQRVRDFAKEIESSKP